MFPARLGLAIGHCVAVVVVTLAVVALAQDPPFHWDIPAPFPRPPVPGDNPMNVAKVELGRRLFYDSRLSVNGTQSCASCHQQALAFTDGKARAIGATGQQHPRGSMSLANVAYNPSLTWANPMMESLEEQALVPLLGADPVEMGMLGREERVLAELRGDSVYRALFPRAFSDEKLRFTMTGVVNAIAAFQRTMLSVRSSYDAYRYGGDTSAISTSAKRGEAFFFSGQRGGCFQCHGGWNFNGALKHETRTTVRVEFFNTGLYNLAGATSYPIVNTGVHRLTGRTTDMGAFRVPTLRNIAVTAPYMHDGSIATLSDVLDHYASGGRTIATGPYAGVGRENPNKSARLRGFPMTADERRDLLAFLETLTDTLFLRNPALSNPWK